MEEFEFAKKQDNSVELRKFIKEKHIIENKIKEYESMKKAAKEQYDNPDKKQGLIIGCLVGVTFVTFIMFFIIFIVSGMGLNAYIPSLFLSIIFTTPVYTVYIIVTRDKSKQFEKLIENEKSNLNKLLNENDDSVQYYQACNNSLQKHRDVPQDQILLLIGAGYGKMDLLSAKEYYLLGKFQLEKNEIAKKDDVLIKNKKEKIEKIEKTDEETREQILNVGKDKYLAEIYKLQKNASNLKSASSSMESFARNNMFYTPKKRDWAIRGGVGSAIGGVGLGLAMAADAQKKNEEEECRVKEKLETAETQIDIAFKQSMLADEISGYARNIIGYFYDVGIDSQNIDEKFSFLHIGKPTFEINDYDEYKIISVAINIEMTKSPQVLLAPAILDGTLKITLRDKLNNNILGVKYFVAPGYGKVNYQYAGFECVKKLKVEYLVQDSGNLSVDNLSCSVEPEVLWAIEKNDEIFKLSNSEIEEKIDGFKKRYEDIALKSIMTL